MKLSFGLPHMFEIKAMTKPWEAAITGADQTRLAKFADEIGFDMIAVPEHYVIPSEHLAVSGSHWLGATAAQAYLAGATARIRVNSCITILPLQNPIVLAKSLATADWFSSGRMMFTVGVGWLEEEFNAFGVPFAERGRIADEYLAAMIELWTSDTPQFEGRYVSFRDIAFEPKPVQRPHLPIWIGGDVDASLRRAARFGTGWWPFLTPPDDIGAKLDKIKTDPAFVDKPFDVMCPVTPPPINARHESTGTGAGGRMSAEQIVDRLGELAAMGVTYSSVPPQGVSDLESFLDFNRWVMEEIKPKVG
jgi:probable F420-dependent oxidoreductase